MARLFKIKSAVLAIVLLSVLCCVCGCKKKQPEVEEQGYNMYYVDESGRKLVKVKYAAQENEIDTSALLNELLWKLGEDDGDNKSARKKVSITRYDLSQGILEIHFDSKYGELTATEDMLLRASTVLTVTQIDAVEYVTFYINDQPHANKYGNVTGAMKAADFIDIDSNDINDYTKAQIHLYFANEYGDKLKMCTVDTAYGNDVSLAEHIILKLIEGPKEDGYERTIPETAGINNVIIRSGICYVDFNEGFLEKALVNDKLVIYSIVNSLSELSYISKVQISVNGDADIKYNTIDLNTTFSRNLDLIETEK